jgi:hypothetical protein
MSAACRIQIPLDEALELEEAGRIPKHAGYHYNHPETGEAMVEYHVDTCNLFQERMNKETTYGGNRSVRYDEEGRMLIIWGHDEAIIKQFTLTTKGWVGPNGETAIVPKDDGAGIMLSAFQFREFGFGLQMSEQDLALVNEYRKDKNYIDQDAAKEKRGDAKKKHLLKAPLYLNLNMG